MRDDCINSAHVKSSLFKQPFKDFLVGSSSYYCRLCDAPAPAAGEPGCDGLAKETRACYLKSCPDRGTFFEKSLNQLQFLLRNFPLLSSHNQLIVLEHLPYSDIMLLVLTI